MKNISSVTSLPVKAALRSANQGERDEKRIVVGFRHLQ